MLKRLLFITIIILPFQVFAQLNSTIELATDYYQKQEFEKAAELYEQLFNQTHAKLYFNFLFNCYTNTKKYSDAEKLVKKQIKYSNNDISYQVTLAKLYSLQGNTEKSKQTISKAIDKLPPDQFIINSFAIELQNERDLESAIKVFEKGQKLLDKVYGFHLELANIYLLNKNYKKMADEYISLLEESPEKLFSIEERLQTLIQNDTENAIGNILKNCLLTKIQSNNKSPELFELLIWVFIQERNYSQALIQAIAIDRRTNNESNTIMSIGEIALSNNDFDAAISSFQYLKDKGQQTSYYYKSECNYLLSLNKKIIINPNHTKKEEIDLELQLKAAIAQYGIIHETTGLIIDLSQLQSHFLNKIDDAITLLESSLTNNSLNNDDKSDIRMKLGDIYLFSGNIWDANLVYAKIENDNQGSPIANDAKFKRAKIAYYTGDYKWAGALLDILKAATSKETSNDAFELSLLISDNSQDDSTSSAMKLFSSADYLLVQNKDSLAILTYDSIPKLYPGNTLEDDILYRKAQICENRNEVDSAISLYQQIVTRFSYEIYADNSLYKLGLLYEINKNNAEKAMDYYKQLISNFSNSIFVFDARIRYRKLKGEMKQ